MSRAASIRPVQSVGILEQPITQGRADHGLESDANFGPSRYIDAATQRIGMLAATWQDFAQLRKAADQRELSTAVVDAMRLAERRVAAELNRSLRKHPLWFWLAQYPGLGGVHTARLISRIGDPRRFPGQQCALGHTTVPQHVIGAACQFTDPEGIACLAPMQPPRSGTGTRSVWHYLGLHVVDGRSPRKTRGRRADWDPIGRTSVLQPDGIADHIVRQRVPTYRDIYDATKERLTRERADSPSGVEIFSGPLPSDEAAEAAFEIDIERGSRAEAVRAGEIDAPTGLRPFQIDAIARKVAAKAFVADLLQAWKGLVA